MDPPLVLDIDGTLTRVDARRTPPAIDPRLFELLWEWNAPVILATGKSFPYPVALAQFLGRDLLAVAETGGIALADGDLRRFVEPGTIDAIKATLRDRGLFVTDGFDDINYWRETELALPRTLPKDELEGIATTHGMSVLDSGYAYHVKHPDVSKGAAVAWIADRLELGLDAMVAIGDSRNDVTTFERVGHSYALANADADARAAADVTVETGHADGAVDVLRRLREQ